MDKITGETKISDLLNDKDSLKHFNQYHDEDGKFTTSAEAVSVAVSNIAKGTKETANAVADLPQIKDKKGTTIRGTYPEMTDEELRNRVNRMNLEQRYSDLNGDTTYVKSGEEKTRETLQTIGAVAGIVATVTPIAIMVGKLIASKAKKKATGN